MEKLLELYKNKIEEEQDDKLRAVLEESYNNLLKFYNLGFTPVIPLTHGLLKYLASVRVITKDSDYNTIIRDISRIIVRDFIKKEFLLEFKREEIENIYGDASPEHILMYYDSLK